MQIDDEEGQDNGHGTRQRFQQPLKDISPPIACEHLRSGEIEKEIAGYADDGTHDRTDRHPPRPHVQPEDNAQGEVYDPFNQWRYQ